MTELAVELYGQRIGAIKGDNYRSFDIEIDPSAIESFGASSRVLSMAVPLDVNRNRSQAKRRRNYFSGIMPEGPQLESMAANAQLHQFDVLGMLARYGRDIAGAAQIWDVNDPGEPRSPKSKLVSNSDVSAMLGNLAAQPLGNDLVGGKTSLPGVQPKIVLAKTPEGWARVEDGYPSTHILKPVLEKYPTMIFDEEYGSRFVRALGLADFSTELREFAGTQALVIERYDRDLQTPSGRVHQEDLAQALGAATIEKYEKYGAITLAKISKLLDDTDDSNPRATLARMLTLSVAVGNLDMHAKNISLLHRQDGSVTVAPMYDVVPQAHYPTDGEFAFRVNGVLTHAAISRDDLIQELTAWGARGRAERLIDETLEIVRDVAKNETPHSSAEPTVRDEILRVTQNLLDGRPVGVNLADGTAGG